MAWPGDTVEEPGAEVFISWCQLTGGCLALEHMRWQIHSSVLQQLSSATAFKVTSRLSEHIKSEMWRREEGAPRRQRTYHSGSHVRGL